MFGPEAGEHEETQGESELRQSVHNKINTASEMPNLPHYSLSPLGGKELSCCMTCFPTSLFSEMGVAAEG